MLLHSAFIRLNSPNSPVNSTVAISSVQLSLKPVAWSDADEDFTKVSDTCDWMPVALFLSVDGKELSLNLERYSYLVKASNGYFARSFYGSDVLRIQNYLSSLSDETNADEDDTLRIVTETGIVDYSLAENTIDN